MALRNIVKEGDPILRMVCKPVEKFDERLWQLLDDMKETLAKSQGVGLAAPQVGILKRVVMDENQSSEIDVTFTTLMGDQVEPRREFIEENAKKVRNLDI